MIFNFKRGEIYLVQEDKSIGSEIKKTRPWVIIGSTHLNKARKTVIAMPLSTKVPEIDGLTVAISINGTNSCAVIDQIRALDKRRFIRCEGALSHHELLRIEECLKQVLCI
jgi:mRNA interferase MazF